MSNTTEYLQSKYEQPSQFQATWIEEHDNFFWRKYMWDHPNVSYYACITYLCVIFGLQKFMKNRSPLKLRRTLVVWNLLLTVFSAIGFFRVTQELLSIWSKPNGFYRSLCVSEGRNVPADFWGLMFVFSKFIELGDTVFIVLRKQPLLALQWYHHCLVTVFAWTLYPWNEPILSWYGFMNFGVHQFMYFYFAMRGLNFKVPEVLAMSITSLQTLQMVLGLGINLYTVYMLGTDEPCNRHPTSIKMGLGVYFSLWILFAKFFRDRYYSQMRLKKLQ